MYSILERPRLTDMETARSRIADVVVNTPLVPLHPHFGAEDVWLKLETHQPVTSFKIRGVFHAVSLLSEQDRARGLGTVSAGNTAQALAWCGRHFGVPAQSLIPHNAPESKVEAVRDYGGKVVLVSTEELFHFLKSAGWQDENYSFIHPWIEPNVMLGHASLGLELLEAAPDLNTVFVPVGGGGLIAGVASAVKSVKPSIRVVAVEPITCCALHESLKAGRAVESPCETLCDGVAVPYLTEEMFPLLCSLVDEVRLVDEDRVRWYVRELALTQKVVAEPSGALALAAACDMPAEKRGKSACIVTGGSIDASKLANILSN